MTGTPARRPDSATPRSRRLTHRTVETTSTLSCYIFVLYCREPGFLALRQSFRHPISEEKDEVMKIIVVRATGTIGAAVAKARAANKHEVVAASRHGAVKVRALRTSRQPMRLRPVAEGSPLC